MESKRLKCPSSQQDKTANLSWISWGTSHRVFWKEVDIIHITVLCAREEMAASLFKAFSVSIMWQQGVNGFYYSKCLKLTNIILLVWLQRRTKLRITNLGNFLSLPNRHWAIASVVFQMEGWTRALCVHFMIRKQNTGPWLQNRLSAHFSEQQISKTKNIHKSTWLAGTWELIASVVYSPS